MTVLGFPKIRAVSAGMAGICGGNGAKLALAVRPRAPQGQTPRLTRLRTCRYVTGHRAGIGCLPLVSAQQTWEGKSFTPVRGLTWDNLTASGVPRCHTGPPGVGRPSRERGPPSKGEGPGCTLGKQSSTEPSERREAKVKGAGWCAREQSR